jgi:hypothetical protein
MPACGWDCTLLCSLLLTLLQLLLLLLQLALHVWLFSVSCPAFVQQWSLSLCTAFANAQAVEAFPLHLPSIVPLTLHL